MALNYLVDAMDSEGHIDRTRESGTFGDHLKGDESPQTKGIHTLLLVEASRHVQSSHRFQIRIRIQNSTIGRRQQHIIPTTSVEEQHLQTKDGGRRRKRRRKTMKRSTLNIVRDKTYGVVILIMSRDENDYNLMTNTTTDIISKGDYINNII